jgi:hypothetical protein
MPKRDDLFQKFGPLQNEGLLLLNLEAINTLRVKAGLTPFTKEQAMTRLEEILETLTPYDWMKEQP